MLAGGTDEVLALHRGQAAQLMVASQANENILNTHPSQFQSLPCLPWPEPWDSAMKARYSLEFVIRDHKQATMLTGCS